MGYTLAQQRALAINPKVSGLLSVLCSCMVIYSVLSDARKRGRIYHRLLLGISCIDMTISSAYFFSTWPIPASSGVLYAVGNAKTCEAQGFFLQLGVGSFAYYGSLSIYYLLSLKYNWPEKRLQRLEPFLHAVPISFALGTAIMGIPLRLYNNSNLWCWIAPYPGKCINHADCIRGAFASNYRWAFWYGPLWGIILFVTYAQTTAFLHVRKMLKERMHHDEHSDVKRDHTSHTDSDDKSAVIEDGEEDELNRKDEELDRNARLTKRRLHEIGLQCFLYATIFYLDWFALTTVRILQAAEHTVPYGLLLTAATVTPFQGAPNLFIYCFPKFLYNRRTYPDAGVWAWMKNSV